MEEDFISLENDWEPEAVAEGEAQAQGQPETQGPAPLAAPNGGAATGLPPGLGLPAPHSAAVQEAAAVPSDEQNQPDFTAAASAEEQLARQPAVPEFAASLPALLAQAQGIPAEASASVAGAADICPPEGAADAGLLTGLAAETGDETAAAALFIAPPADMSAAQPLAEGPSSERGAKHQPAPAQHADSHAAAAMDLEKPVAAQQANLNAGDVAAGLPLLVFEDTKQTPPPLQQPPHQPTESSASPEGRDPRVAVAAGQQAAPAAHGGRAGSVSSGTPAAASTRKAARSIGSGSAERSVAGAALRQRRGRQQYGVRDDRRSGRGSSPSERLGSSSRRQVNAGSSLDWDRQWRNARSRDFQAYDRGLPRRQREQADHADWEQPGRRHRAAGQRLPSPTSPRGPLSAAAAERAAEAERRYQEAAAKLRQRFPEGGVEYQQQQQELRQVPRFATRDPRRRAASRSPEPRLLRPRVGGGGGREYGGPPASLHSPCWSEPAPFSSNRSMHLDGPPGGQYIPASPQPAAVQQPHAFYAASATPDEPPLAGVNTPVFALSGYPRDAPVAAAAGSAFGVLPSRLRAAYGDRAGMAAHGPQTGAVPHFQQQQLLAPYSPSQSQPPQQQQQMPGRYNPTPLQPLIQEQQQYNGAPYSPQEAPVEQLQPQQHVSAPYNPGPQYPAFTLQQQQQLQQMNSPYSPEHGLHASYQPQPQQPPIALGPMPMQPIQQQKQPQQRLNASHSPGPQQPMFDRQQQRQELSSAYRPSPLQPAGLALQQHGSYRSLSPKLQQSAPYSPSPVQAALLQQQQQQQQQQYPNAPFSPGLQQPLQPPHLPLHQSEQCTAGQLTTLPDGAARLSALEQYGEQYQPLPAQPAPTHAYVAGAPSIVPPAGGPENGRYGLLRDERSPQPHSMLRGSAGEDAAPQYQQHQQYQSNTGSSRVQEVSTGFAARPQQEPDVERQPQPYALVAGGTQQRSHPVLQQAGDGRMYRERPHLGPAVELEPQEWEDRRRGPRDDRQQRFCSARDRTNSPPPDRRYSMRQQRGFEDGPAPPERRRPALSPQRSRFGDSRPRDLEEPRWLPPPPQASWPAGKPPPPPGSPPPPRGGGRPPPPPYFDCAGRARSPPGRFSEPYFEPGEPPYPRRTRQFEGQPRQQHGPFGAERRRGASPDAQTWLAGDRLDRERGWQGRAGPQGGGSHHNARFCD